jgi:hypothetical protein
MDYTTQFLLCRKRMLAFSCVKEKSIAGNENINPTVTVALTQL